MKIRNLKSQKGMSLLEVLVSMLICGIGLAGMVSAIQASQRLATSAEYRAVATREIQSMVDMMRANRLGADGYITATDVSFTGKSPSLKLCEDRTKVNTNARKYCMEEKNQAVKIAASEGSMWVQRIEEGIIDKDGKTVLIPPLLPNSKAEIDASDRGGIYVFTVKISWTVGNENPSDNENPISDSIQMSFAL